VKIYSKGLICIVTLAVYIDVLVKFCSLLYTNSHMFHYVEPFSRGFSYPNWKTILVSF